LEVWEWKALTRSGLLKYHGRDREQGEILRIWHRVACFAFCLLGGPSWWPTVAARTSYG